MEKINEEKSDCEKFLGLVQLLIDDEANSSQKSYINDHIDECAPCLKHLEVEKEFRELVKQKIERKEVPQELIQAIETKIKDLVSPA